MGPLSGEVILDQACPKVLVGEEVCPKVSEQKASEHQGPSVSISHCRAKDTVSRVIKDFKQKRSKNQRSGLELEIFELYLRIAVLVRRKVVKNIISLTSLKRERKLGDVVASF